MASLTHVKMWSDHGWVPITAEAAAFLHPDCTVSTRSGLFICDLCGQYVGLTQKRKNVRHFRHSSYEKSKSCPERTFSPGTMPPSYASDAHELPVKICNVSDAGFSFEIGFLYLPAEILCAADIQTVEIIPNGAGRSYQYSFERLNENSLSYLLVGDYPAPNYAIHCDKSLEQFWPKTVRGIDPTGGIFDVKSGRMLPCDADVGIGKKYYLLTLGSFPSSQHKSIQIKQICQKRFDWRCWHLYEVEASEYDEEAAKFFLDLHCRLTDAPLSIQPVWPLYIQTPFVIKHNGNPLVLCVKGNYIGQVKSFPQTNKSEYSCPCGGKVAKISGIGRQQLISAGRTREALQYLYAWKEPLPCVTEQPQVKATDIWGAPFVAGETARMPDKNTLVITAPYDGKLVVIQNGHIIEKRSLSANVPTDVDNLKYGAEIIVLQGLDAVWSISFVRQHTECSISDSLLLQRLSAMRGKSVAINHNLGALAGRLERYPQTKRWLYKQIKGGQISRNALHSLRNTILCDER